MINMTEEQIKLARVHIENFDEFYKENNLYRIQILLDDEIIAYLDDNYDTTETSRMLQRLYDEIYSQN